MSFRDNLLHLRQEHNMTQEQFAMLMGVSRQSVTKWESGKSYPEMDKLMKMCDLFECSLDDLVKGDLTQQSAAPGKAFSAASASSDVTGYDAQKLSFAWRVALGVALEVFSCAIFSFEDLNVVAVLLGFVFVATGLLLIIPAAFSSMAFAREHPYIVNFYTSEQRQRIRTTGGYELAGGIGLVLLGVGAAALLDEAIDLGALIVSGGSDSPVVGAAFFTLVAVGVFFVVHAALRMSRIDIEDYNLSALGELDQEEVAEIVGEDRADQVIEKLKVRRKLGAACGIIMLVATIVALMLLFLHPAGVGEYRMFWVPWMIGGIMCGIAAIAMKPAGK